VDDLPATGWPLARLVGLAEASPGEEVCGLLVRAGGVVDCWPVRNVAPEPARAFELSPLELLAALRRLDLEGAELVAVYHSHLAGGAGLSPRDLAGALVDGAPVLPGAAQLVLGLARGRVSEVRVHRWTGSGFTSSEPESR
jgi:proteasome lid subunit RPN8/RPN11